MAEIIEGHIGLLKSARIWRLIVKKVRKLKRLFRIFGQKCMFCWFLVDYPLLFADRENLFCFRKNGANSGRTPKNAIFRR